MRHRVIASTLALILAATPGLGEHPADGTRVVELVTEAGRLFQAGDLEAAEQGFAAARDLAPELPLPWLGLADVREQQGQFVAALEMARRARSSAPEMPAAALAVGRLLARLGVVGEAVEVLTEARSLAPREFETYLIAALLLRDADRGTEAIEWLEQGLQQVSRPELSEELGMLLLSDGQPARALQVAQAALREHPQRGQLQLIVGLALAADPARRTEAASRLEQALELGVTDPGRVHLEIGALLVEQGLLEPALRRLDTARQLLPDSPEAYYRLGATLRKAGDLDGAKAALERFSQLSQTREAAERQDKETGAALNEIQSLATGNRLPEALERLESLLRAHPQEPRGLTLQAKILFSMGRRAEALESVVAAREIAPGQIEPHYLEGLFLAHLGRPDEAEVALRRALALDSTLEDARALLARLAAASAGNREGSRP